MTDISHDRLLIIDFGSQVTQLIARRLRELNVFCEIHPFNTGDDAFLKDFAPKAVILSGGPSSVFAEGAPMPPQSVFELGVPILGICYGQQVMMHCLGGKVERGHGTAEFGRAYVTPSEARLELLEGWFLTEKEQVWMSHGDHVSAIAPGFEVYGTSPLSRSPAMCRATSMPCSSTPKCTTPPMARACMKTLCVSRVSRATGQ